MLTKGDKIAFSVIGILILVLILFRKDIISKEKSDNKKVVQAALNENKKGDKKKGKKDKTKDEEKNISVDSKVAIAQKWELPTALKEISGIAYIDDQRFACIQDEQGMIFIYNTATKEVEKQIPFAAPGDYEGIALVNTTAYVLRADGKLFEVKGYNSNNPSIVQHSTQLTEKQDVEGLCYDKKNNRLLLAIKGEEPTTKEYKGIYAFDIAAKKFISQPAYKVDLTHSIWNSVNTKSKMEPSDLEVHPATGDLYIIDGADPKLLIMGADGTKKNLHPLNTDDFAQPEGIAFTQTGELFISNEGKTGVGNILKVSIN